MRDDGFLNLLDQASNEELDRLTKMMNIHEISERLAKNSAETAKLQAETARIQQEMKYYPWLTAGGTAIFLFILNVLAKKLGIM